jgi:hypothetical protein
MGHRLFGQRLSHSFLVVPGAESATKCGGNRRNIRAERKVAGSVLTGGEDHGALGHDDGRQERQEGNNKDALVHFLS